MQQYNTQLSTQYGLLIRQIVFLLANKRLRAILYMSEVLTPVFHQLYNFAVLHNDPRPLIKES
jgi:hypothetical protein